MGQKLVSERERNKFKQVKIQFVGDEILVTGGEGSLNQVFALAADGTWGPRESMTFARYDHACMAFNMDGETN